MDTHVEISNEEKTLQEPLLWMCIGEVDKILHFILVFTKKNLRTEFWP